MQKLFGKLYKTMTSTDKLTPIMEQWPMAIVVFGLAITPAWAGVLFWFLFHWLWLRTSY